MSAYYGIMFEWLAWCIPARVHLLDVRRVHIEQWAKKLKEVDGLAASTRLGKLRLVRNFYRWAFEEGHRDHDVAVFVRLPYQPRRSNLRWLDQDQATQLLDASRELGPPWSGLFHLLLLNGLRKTETLDARVEHLFQIEGKTALHLPNRKKGHMDNVTLPTVTADVLAECIRGREKGPILLEKGKRVRDHRLYAVCNQISDACNLDFPVRPHMLRATFVTLSLDAGVPIRDVMASMGVSSAQIVHYYDRAHASIRRNASHRLAEYLT